MKTAIAYVRVSTPGQAESGVSPAVQRQDIERYAADEGYTIAGWFADEGISGAKPPDKRPGLLAALAAAETTGAVIVWKRDRLCRSVPLMCVLEQDLTKKGVRILSVQERGTNGESPEACLLRRLLDAIAEHKILVTKMRTQRALARKREQGEQVGAVRFGFDAVPSGRTNREGREIMLEVPNAGEQTVLAEIFRMRDAGLSYARIASHLNAQSVPAKSGGRWWDSAIGHVVRSGRRPVCAA